MEPTTIAIARVTTNLLTVQKILQRARLTNDSRRACPFHYGFRAIIVPLDWT